MHQTPPYEFYRKQLDCTAEFVHQQTEASRIPCGRCSCNNVQISLGTERHFFLQLEHDTPVHKKLVAPFKLLYSEDDKDNRFGSILNGLAAKHLSDDLRALLRIVVCFKSAPNLFRLRYGGLINVPLMESI